MSDTEVFVLAQIVKSANGDPSGMVDAIWEAGYRQPERTAEEAASLTLATIRYCQDYDMPDELWPEKYEDVLTNELMKAVLADYEECGTFTLEQVKVARNVINAGFRRESDTCR